MDCGHLKGQHDNTVLCITSNSDGTIATGGEDGELCLWNKDASSVRKLGVDEDVTSVTFSNKNPNHLFVAVGTQIMVFDISKELDTPVENFKFNQDEINQIVLNDKEEFLATCDDSGEVKIINLQEKKVFKTLRKHTSICSCVAFRPKRPWELVSGGLDSHLFRCDFSRGKSLQIVNMQDLVIDSELPGYMLNPPFVHSIDFSMNADFLACGIENGQIHVFDCTKKAMSLALILKGHSRGVSQVHYPKLEGFESHLISGGNDDLICVWDLKNKVATAPEVSTIAPIKVISHGSKVNWIHTCQMEKGACILVADLTSNVTIYNL